MCNRALERSCRKLQLYNVKILDQNSYGNFVTNHVIHNLGIQELHLGITRILTILMQPSPLIKKCVYKEEVLQPHFEASVKMRLTFPKVGIRSPPRLPQL